MGLGQEGPTSPIGYLLYAPNWGAPRIALRCKPVDWSHPEGRPDRATFRGGCTSFAHFLEAQKPGTHIIKRGSSDLEICRISNCLASRPLARLPVALPSGGNASLC